MLLFIDASLLQFGGPESFLSVRITPCDLSFRGHGTPTFGSKHPLDIQGSTMSHSRSGESPPTNIRCPGRCPARATDSAVQG